MSGFLTRRFRAMMGCGLAVLFLLGAGCNLFTGKADADAPLDFSRANYAQQADDGAAVFTLSETGKKAMADKEAGIVKEKKKKWWKFW